MCVLTDREGTRKSLWLIGFYSRNGFLSLRDPETKKDLSNIVQQVGIQPEMWLGPGPPLKISHTICRAQCKIKGFPGGSDGKESACNAGDTGLIPGSGRSPGEGNGYSLQYSCLENPMVGYSPWGPREPDMTERLTLTQNEM